MPIIAYLMKVFKGSVIFAVMILMGGNIYAQGESLSAEARQAFERGLAAAGQKEWGLAAGYFSKAQEAAPFDANVLFNLGLAHAKAGHELAAIAWFRAYLQAVSDSGKAEQISKEIISLDVAVEARIRKIIQGAIDAAGQLQDDYKKGQAFVEVAKIQAKTGDIEGALISCKKSAYCESNLSWLWSDYGLRQARAGDLKGAQEALAHIEDSYKSGVFTAIAGFYIESGDLDAAKKLADENKVYSRDDMLAKIFAVYKERQDLKAARGIAKQMGEGSYRTYAFLDLLKENIAEGDFVPVEEELGSLGQDGRAVILSEVTDKYIRQKDFAQAGKAAGRIEKKGQRAMAMEKVLLAQIDAQDMEGAKQTALEITALADKSVLSDVLKFSEAVESAENKDTVKAFNRIQEISDPVYKYDALMRISSILQKLGNKDSAGQAYQQAEALNISDELKNKPGDRIAGDTSLALAYSVLGKHDLSRQLAQGVWFLVGYADFPNGPQRDWCLGNIAFIEAMAGNFKEAEKTAGFAQELALGSKTGSAWAGIAKALLRRQENFKQALNYTKQTKYLIRRKLLYEIVLAQIKAGDLTSAEDTTALITAKKEDAADLYAGGYMHYANEKLNSLLAIAEAYRIKGQTDKARQIISEAVLTAALFDNDSGFKAVSLAQEKIGDTADAEKTKFIIKSYAGGLRSWVDKAKYLSKEPNVTGLEEELEKTKTKIEYSGEVIATENIPRAIAEVAAGLDLLRVEMIELERVVARGRRN